LEQAKAKAEMKVERSELSKVPPFVKTLPTSELIWAKAAGYIAFPGIVMQVMDEEVAERLEHFDRVCISFVAEPQLYFVRKVDTIPFFEKKTVEVRIEASDIGGVGGVDEKDVVRGRGGKLTVKREVDVISKHEFKNLSGDEGSEDHGNDSCLYALRLKTGLANGKLTGEMGIRPKN